MIKVFAPLTNNAEQFF